MRRNSSVNSSPYSHGSVGGAPWQRAWEQSAPEGQPPPVQVPGGSVGEPR